MCFALRVNEALGMINLLTFLSETRFWVYHRGSHGRQGFLVLQTDSNRTGATLIEHNG